MSDEDEDRTGEYSSYQRTIYVGGSKPIFSTALHNLAELARQKLEAGPFNYVYGSAGQRQTDDNVGRSPHSNECLTEQLYRMLPRSRSGESFLGCSSTPTSAT